MTTGKSFKAVSSIVYVNQLSVVQHLIILPAGVLMYFSLTVILSVSIISHFWSELNLAANVKHV